MAAPTFIHGTNDSLFLFADHASRHIPGGYDNLGLSGDDLTRHIAWDIGTEALTRRLVERFECAALLAGVSRLVIDCNRDPDHGGLIPQSSDGTEIPGNQGLTPAQRAARKRDYFDPYHAALSEALDRRPHSFAVAIHSFTPHPRTGARRTVDLGLLAKRAEDGGDWQSAEQFLAALPSHLQTGINVPYSAYDLNHTIDTHVISRELRHLAIEVRQDHLKTDSDIARMAAMIGDALATLVKE